MADDNRREKAYWREKLASLPTSPIENNHPQQALYISMSWPINEYFDCVFVYNNDKSEYLNTSVSKQIKNTTYFFPNTKTKKEN